jgi:hypothetical protein
MSNKLPKFFALCCLGLILRAYGQSVPADRLAAADVLFEEGQHAAAIEQYEAIYREGYFDEQMLYHMAFACEQVKKIPQSIYYLRKAQWEYGNSLTDAKVAQLVQEMGAARFVIATEWPQYHAFIHRSYEWWLFLLMLLLGLAIALLRGGGQSKRLIGGIAVATLALFLAMMLVEHSFLSPGQGVIVGTTSFYEEPAYTANSKEIPISPGTLVHIKSRHDIWYNVSFGHYECWIPALVVMKL